MNKEDVVRNLIEIEPVNSDEFLKIKETLTRIGIVSRRDVRSGGLPILWQSCHILHKQGRYFIVHFKELFLLDGKEDKTDFAKEDFNRTKIIATLLNKWGLVTLKTPVDATYTDNKIVIVPYRDKSKWNLRAKYSIGRKSD